MNDLMELIDAYAQACCSDGWMHNPTAEEARKRVSDYIDSIGAGGVSGPLMGLTDIMDKAMRYQDQIRELQAEIARLRG